MKVFIDHREKKAAELVRKVWECEIAHLPLGDLLVVGDLGALVVERKTAYDFISSVRSNRLWDQLLRLMKTERILGYEVRRRLLVIHGSFGEYIGAFPEESKRFWSSITGALLEVLFVYDTPFIICENDDAFEAFLRILLKREEEGRHEGLPKARWYRKPVSRLPIKDEKLYLLDAIPMIGEVQAKNLLNYYGSISNIANASKNELMRAPGIGEKRAEKIYEIFH